MTEEESDMTRAINELQAFYCTNQAMTISVSYFVGKTHYLHGGSCTSFRVS